MLRKGSKLPFPAQRSWANVPKVRERRRAGCKEKGIRRAGGPAFPADAATSSPTETFLDQAKASPAARRAFRWLMASVRVANGFVPTLSNTLIELVVDKVPDLVTMGGLTIISNIYGNPAVSIPAGTVNGLPVGMQVLARHHRDRELFDVALAYEREIGWPKVAPSVTASAPQPA